jgi:hypothetical protein
VRQLLLVLVATATLFAARSASAQVEAFCGDGVCVPFLEDDCMVDCGCAARESCSAEPQTVGCYCDTACLDFGDCCADACEVCGSCPLLCGDSHCYVEGGETCSTCPSDCGVCPPGPANDDFANPVEVPELAFSTTTSTRYATLEDGEPEPCGSIGATIWYRWTPSKSVTVRAETSGSDYDTVLAAYSGKRAKRQKNAATLQSLTLLGCNDDSGSDRRSEVSFLAQAGQTYYIQVGGYEARFGNLVLHVQAAVCGDGTCDVGEDAASCAADCGAPANDDFADAIAVTALPFSIETSTEHATVEDGEPGFPCGSIGATIWYRWSPSEDVAVTADTFGSDYDTMIAAYSGTSLASLSLLACNDDATDLQSKVGFAAEAGETYYLQVGGLNGAGGNLVLHVEPALCGDGTCDLGEDAASCAADCGCAAGACGGVAPAGCSCETLCIVDGDCCPDACDVCGECAP